MSTGSPQTAQATVCLLPEDREYGARFYRTYTVKEGSQDIASEIALTYLAAVLRTYRPQVVLECGAGIGTMTDAILSHPSGVRQVVTTEDNDFCLQALRTNLAHQDPQRYQVVTSEEELRNLDLEADLVIGDGGWYSDDEYRFASAGTVVMVEGWRVKFREKLAAAMTRRTPPLQVHFTEYGSIYKWEVYFTRRFRIPIPRGIRKVQAQKGCYLGQVMSR